MCVKDMHFKSKKEVNFQRKKHGKPNILSNWSIPTFAILCKLKYLVKLLTLSLSLKISLECVRLILSRARMKNLTILRSLKLLLRTKVGKM